MVPCTKLYTAKVVQTASLFLVSRKHYMSLSEGIYTLKFWEFQCSLPNCYQDQDLHNISACFTICFLIYPNKYNYSHFSSTNISKTKEVSLLVSNTRGCHKLACTANVLSSGNLRELFTEWSHNGLTTNLLCSDLDRNSLQHILHQSFLKLQILCLHC